MPGLVVLVLVMLVAPTAPALVMVVAPAQPPLPALAIVKFKL